MCFVKTLDKEKSHDIKEHSLRTQQKMTLYRPTPGGPAALLLLLLWAFVAKGCVSLAKSCKISPGVF